MKIYLRSKYGPLDIAWPEGWPVPLLYANVHLPGGVACVRSISYHPLGDGVDGDPFIVLILDGRRRS